MDNGKSYGKENIEDIKCVGEINFILPRIRSHYETESFV
jgi:hypothetical protein